MKKVFPYYELTSSIRYGNKPWPEYPHVYFANLEISEASLRAFTGLYGQLFERFDATRPLRKTLMETMDAEAPRPLSVEMVQEMQALLRDAWRNSLPDLEILAGHDKTRTGIIYGEMHPQLTVTSTGIELVTPDVWTFARLAFLCDHAAGKTQICANPDCKSPHGTPYFLQSKKGQMFCCHRCAVLVNVRRFRRDLEAKPKIKARSTRKRHKR